MGNEKRPKFNFDWERKNKAYVVSHIQSMELMRELEDEAKCSGICKSSLFYYGLNIDKGMPMKTCLLPLKQEIFGDQAYDLGSVFVLAGINALVMFLTHGLLFFRPKVSNCPLGFTKEEQSARQNGYAEGAIDTERRGEEAESKCPMGFGKDVGTVDTERSQTTELATKCPMGFKKDQ